MEKTKTDKPCSNIFPEWHSEICKATKTICDHVSFSVLRHVKEHIAAMANDDADFQSISIWINQFFITKMDSHIRADTFFESMHPDFVQRINPNQEDDNISELYEKQCRAFFLAGYIAGATDMDALPK